MRDDLPPTRTRLTLLTIHAPAKGAMIPWAAMSTRKRTKRTVPCKHCRQPTRTSASHSRVFCRRCRKLPVDTCDNCGSAMTPAAKKRFCNPTCKSLAYNRRTYIGSQPRSPCTACHHLGTCRVIVHTLAPLPCFAEAGAAFQDWRRNKPRLRSWVIQLPAQPTARCARRGRG